MSFEWTLLMEQFKNYETLQIYKVGPHFFTM